MRGACAGLRRQLRGDGLGGVDGASPAERHEAVGTELDGARGRLLHRLDRDVRPDAVVHADDGQRAGSGRPPPRRHEERTPDLDLLEDVPELRQRPGAEARDPHRPRVAHAGPVAAESSRPRTATRSRANWANSCAARVGDARRPAREDDLAGSVHPLDPGLGEHARGELGLDGPARDERHAEAREHRAPHRLLQAELEAQVEIADPNAEPAKLVVDDPPHAGALLHDDERLARELVGADRLAREAMAGRAHEHDLVVGERLELDAAVARRGADDAELQLPLGDEVDHRPRVVHLERDADGRVVALELAEELRHDHRGGPVEAPIESTPVRSPSASETTSESTCSSSASSRCAPRYRRRPASVGSTRRPDRSRSWVPSRFSSARTCSETAGWVTPRRSAAWEKERRSTTAQNAAS